MALFTIRFIVIAILSALVIGYVFRGDQINGEYISIENGYGGVKFREFDFFKLALQWPGTVCRFHRKCCPSNGCCRGPDSPNYFTIHGLWPHYNDGTWPACCNGPEFDEQEVSTLVDGLNKYWPTFSCYKVRSCYGRKGSFWAHEWEKHGTCSSPVVHDQYDYFLRTMMIYFKYNVTEVLREAGYVPSNYDRYPLGGIISAIQNAFHVTPEIECKGAAVVELRLCFFKDFKLRDCNAGSNMQDFITSVTSSCPDYVGLPRVPEHISTELENNGSGTSSLPGTASI